MKQIQPGKPCIIKGSLDNDGKIVIPDVHVGQMRFGILVGGFDMVTSTEDAWHITTPLKAMDGRETDVLQTRILFPLDNPGEDEVDSLSIRKEHAREC